MLTEEKFSFQDEEDDQKTNYAQDNPKGDNGQRTELLAGGFDPQVDGTPHGSEEDEFSPIFRRQPGDLPV